MKQFDLEKALAGAPVVLCNGEKAYVLADMRKLAPNIDPESEKALQGVVISDCYGFMALSWTVYGRCFNSGKFNYDIVGMWQEPRANVTVTFPKPLTHDEAVELGTFYSVQIPHKEEQDIIKYIKWYDTSGLNVDKGLFFATREDAEAFVKAIMQAKG
ncbi:hypothetical protein ACWA5Z_06510 [Testudinibacter sp. P80/BLE/0925]